MAYSQHTCPSSLTALERHALTALWRTTMPDAGRGALLISQLQVRQRDFSAVDPAHCCGFYVTLAPCSEWVEMSAALQHASVAGTHPALPAGAMFMLFTAPVLPWARKLIPAVVHIDGSARVQTVDGYANPRYRLLLEAFARLTGVPVLLNTSFNVNEPIVCTPEDAVRCFLRTDVEWLVMGNLLARRPGPPMGSSSGAER